VGYPLLRFTLASVAGGLATETVAAVDRAAATWQEWDLRLLATLGADGGVHLPLWSTISAGAHAAAVRLVTPFLAARRAALRVIGITLSGQKARPR